MDTNFVKKFKERWPNWFEGLDKSPMESCLAFGFECGGGWFQLLWDLCEDIEKLDGNDTLKVCQVKEKFGELRFYVYGGTKEIDKRISKAEQESLEICENCGSKDGVTTKGKWLKTLCQKCRNET